MKDEQLGNRKQITMDDFRRLEKENLDKLLFHWNWNGDKPCVVYAGLI